MISSLPSLVEISGRRARGVVMAAAATTPAATPAAAVAELGKSPEQGNFTQVIFAGTETWV